MNLVEGENSRYCNNCNKLKLFNNFHKNKSGKYGYRELCKKCISPKQKKTYQKHKKKRLKEATKYRKENRQKINNYFYLKRVVHGSIERNIEKFKEKLFQKKYCAGCDEYVSFDNYHKHSRNENNMKSRCKNCVNKYKRDLEKTNVNFKLKRRNNTSIYNAIKNNKTTKKVKNLLGCTIEELKQHLESQWEEGMSWDNWTTDGWHIDHIKPISSFDLTDPEQQKECFHYTNLQPLWAEDNLSKSNKIINDEIQNT